MIFDQRPFQCRMDWGLTGIRHAAAREDIVWDSSSGRELRSFGIEDDISFCSQLNVLPSVPILEDKHFRGVMPTRQ